MERVSCTSQGREGGEGTHVGGRRGSINKSRKRKKMKKHLKRVKQKESRGSGKRRDHDQT